MNITTKSKPSILCVDDEPQILEGLALHLGRHYEVITATSAVVALEILAQSPAIAVIMSDMRMPIMDGATLLARARQLAPDTVRLLLTGQADINSAIVAINDGQIFRFLTKPCSPPLLLAAMAAAVAHHQLIISERVLLEQTLHGSIKTLTDVLALVSPTSFGRSARIKQLVSELAEKLGIRERWQVEVAAMLSQLGCIALPPETAERVYYGLPLSVNEQKLVAKLPAVTEDLLGNIPRLEAVREILRSYSTPYRPDPAAQSDQGKRIVARGAQLLRVALDFDALESSASVSSILAVATLRSQVGQYDPEVLEALVAIRGADQPADVRELSANDLRIGMIFAEDVKMQNGVLLIARGYEVTKRFLELARDPASGISQQKTWRVLVRIHDLK